MIVLMSGTPIAAEGDGTFVEDAIPLAEGTPAAAVFVRRSCWTGTPTGMPAG